MVSNTNRIDKVTIFILIFFLILNVNFSKTAARSPHSQEESKDQYKFLSEEPYMTITVRGYGDRDGRFYILITRHYFNPSNEEMEINDRLEDFEMEDVNNVSEGLDIEKVDNEGSEGLKITGESSEIDESVTLKKEYRNFLNRRGGRYGENFIFMADVFDRINDYNSLPLKRIGIFISFSQTAVNMGETEIILYRHKESKENKRRKLKDVTTLHPDESEGRLPSISWTARVDDEDFDEEFMDEITRVGLNLSYDIPDGVKFEKIDQFHNQHYLNKIFGIVIVALIISNLYLWKKFRGKME
ncbi:hypothetical protein [Natranaerofaba carboxydovora]|uniref:hypothetical protein n=1 Tax=Natranaerofaba carboxydovora TaxID=2742683 RepID=UPI001F137AD1|nr:hypothetical protein [Natranaerofaba carboxydovora]UMZ74401.1 hypothetical protein ACONDI_01989 [Natranaerofaba carboxydovora]